ncbi:MAG: hypothetical protein WCV81_05310 [Microgenomates group bacterium]
MKKKNNFVIFTILLTLILGIIFTHNDIFNQIKKSLFFSRSSADKPPIQAKDLNQFYQWIKEDPLFTSPDFDSPKFLEDVLALETEEKLIQTYLKTSDPLYPVAFLKDIVEVDKQHKEFISKPSTSSALLMVSVYRKTQQDYQTSITSLNKVLQGNQFPDSSSYIGINTSVSYQVIRSDLAKLVENANELGREIDNREHCLQTGVGCQIPTSSLVEPQIKAENTKFSQKDILPNNVLFRKDEQKRPFFGPYVVSTACYGWSQDLKPIFYPFYVSDIFFARELSNLDKANLKLASTNFYIKLVANPSGIGNFLTKSNSAWILQTETNLYMCNDPSYEATLVAIDKFYRSYKNLPLFAKILQQDTLPEEVKQAAQKGDTLEKAFFKEEFPSEVSADNLTQYYAYFYKILGDVQTDEVKKMREEFLTRSLEYQRKIGKINLLMTNIVLDMHRLRQKMVIAKNQNESTFIYGFRNFYGLFYLTFSPSFYRLPEHLAYLDKKKVEISPDSRGFYMTYQQALKDYTQEEIAKWNLSQLELLKKEINSVKESSPDASI